MKIYPSLGPEELIAVSMGDDYCQPRSLTQKQTNRSLGPEEPIVRAVLTGIDYI